MIKYLILVVLFIASCTVVSAELPDITTVEDVVLDQGIHFIRPESKYVVPTSSRPHYLSVDSVNFIACIEEDVVPQAFIVCLDNNNFKEVDMSRWPQEDFCYAGGATLSDFDCQNAIVEVEYEVESENLKLSEEFIIDTFSTVAEKLINAQYSDGGWLTSEDTAFAILGLAHFDEIFSFEINKALEWLKLNRNNDEKCWPKSPCNLELSAKILALLAESNINGSYRVVTDGRNFLEERQNYYEQDDSWVLAIEDVSVSTTLSLVAIGTELLDTNFSIPANGTKLYNFTVQQNKNLTVIADQNVVMTIYNQIGDEIYVLQGDNLTFTIPAACWSLNLPGEPCDTGTTAYAVASNISIHRAEEALDYMKTELRRGVVTYYYGDENEPVESALYLRSLYDPDLLDENPADDDQDETNIYAVLQWVLFNQKNEGYWGDEFDGDTDDDDFEEQQQAAYTEQLKKTAFVSMSLLDSGFNRSSEPLVDAKDWIASIEDDINESSGSALGAAFFLVRDNAYPLLYAESGVIVVDQQTKNVQFINPTPFNYRDLSFTLSPSVKDYVSLDEKSSLGAFNYRNIEFQKTKAITETVYGFLSVGNADQEIARIPIIVRDAPTLTINAVKSVSVFGKSGSVTISATKSNHPFICKVTWDLDELEPIDFTLTSASYNLPLKFSESVTKEDVYNGNLLCKNSGQEFDFPISITAKRYAARPLTVFPSGITFNDTFNPPSLLLQNNLDIDLVVKVSADRFANELIFAGDVFLRPGESQNISIRGNFDPLLNYTGTSVLTFSTADTTEKVNVLIDVKTRSTSSSSIVRLIVILTFITALLGIGGYLIYSNRDKLLVYINKIPIFQSKAQIAKQKDSLDHLRVDEKNKAILNMYSIMKFQQASDGDIKKKLTSIFSKEEIAAALKDEGILIDGLEESEPEKV